MSRNGSGVYSLPPGLPSNGDTSDVSDLITPLQDLETDMNTARPVVAGGTGQTTVGATQTAFKIAPFDGSATVSGGWTITGTWNMSGATLTMPTQLEVLNGSSITGLSGSDLDLVTGTAGTSGNLSEWNADGDLVDGPAYGTSADDLLQLDSSGLIPTSLLYGETAAQTLNTETAVLVGGIPSWATEIEIPFSSASLSGSDNILVQIGDSGGIETTGYDSDAALTNGGATGSANETTGFAIRVSGGGRTVKGVLKLTKEPSADTWAASGVFGLGSGIVSYCAGEKTLSGTLTQVNVTRDGSNTFDGGTFSVRWRM